MNTLEFDKRLIETAQAIKYFNSVRTNQQTYKQIFSFDLSSILMAYLSVRDVLIRNRRGDEAYLCPLTLKQLQRELYSIKSSKRHDLSQKNIAHNLRTASCFLNKAIIRILKEGVLTASQDNHLAKAVYLPISMLPVKYHQFISKVIEIMAEPTGIFNMFSISIVGSQALFAFLVTILETHIDPRELFNFMETRDLDIRLLVPENFTDEQFKYCIELIKYKFQFSPSIIERCFISPSLKYCTFTDHGSKLDFVLSTDHRQFSNCAISIPLTNFNRATMRPEGLLSLSNCLIDVPSLDEDIENNNVAALAFIMKLINILTPWDMRLLEAQQKKWDSISDLTSIRAIYDAKYLPTAYKPKDSTVPAVSLTDKDFPPLVPSSIPSSHEGEPTERAKQGAVQTRMWPSTKKPSSTYDMDKQFPALSLGTAARASIKI